MLSKWRFPLELAFRVWTTCTRGLPRAKQATRQQRYMKRSRKKCRDVEETGRESDQGAVFGVRLLPVIPLPNASSTQREYTIEIETDEGRKKKKKEKKRRGR